MSHGAHGTGDVSKGFAQRIDQRTVDFLQGIFRRAVRRRLHAVFRTGLNHRIDKGFLFFRIAAAGFIAQSFQAPSFFVCKWNRKIGIEFGSGNFEAFGRVNRLEDVADVLDPGLVQGVQADVAIREFFLVSADSAPALLAVGVLDLDESLAAFNAAQAQALAQYGCNRQRVQMLVLLTHLL